MSRSVGWGLTASSEQEFEAVFAAVAREAANGLVFTSDPYFAFRSGRLAALAQRYGVPDLLARIMACRGIGLEEAAHFLSPSLKTSLPDPSGHVWEVAHLLG